MFVICVLSYNTIRMLTCCKLPTGTIVLGNLKILQMILKGKIVCNTGFHHSELCSMTFSYCIIQYAWWKLNFYTGDFIIIIWSIPHSAFHANPIQTSHLFKSVSWFPWITNNSVGANLKSELQSDNVWYRCTPWGNCFLFFVVVNYL